MTTASTTQNSNPRTYEVRTFGCQMNVHDSERIAGLLEDAGYDVEREFEIGQREVYMPELEAGEIDVFPEYTGNLLQYLDGDSEASTSEEV